MVNNYCPYSIFIWEWSDSTLVIYHYSINVNNYFTILYKCENQRTSIFFVILIGGLKSILYILWKDILPSFNLKGGLLTTLSFSDGRAFVWEAFSTTKSTSRIGYPFEWNSTILIVPVPMNITCYYEMVQYWFRYQWTIYLSMLI